MGGYGRIAKTFDYLFIKRCQGYKIVSYVGNITDNKNQIMLAETIKYHLQNERIIAVYAGREMDNGCLRKEIMSFEQTYHNILIGFCDELENLWSLIDTNVFLSKNDGFGLSIIEAGKHGIPSVAFSDLDAISDLSDSSYLVEINKRSTSDVATSLRDCLSKQWDSNIICRSIRRFSLENMARSYIQLYANMQNNTMEDKKCTTNRSSSQKQAATTWGGWRLPRI